MVRLVEVLVENICVKVVVDMPVTEPVVVTVVNRLPVIKGLSVIVATVAAGAVVTVLVVVLEDA